VHKKGNPDLVQLRVWNVSVSVHVVDFEGELQLPLVVVLLVESEFGQAQDELFEVHLTVRVPVEDVDHAFHQRVLRVKKLNHSITRKCSMD